ncbi:uncharacterized protein LOC128203416 [Mya arenaria]|uniref:uncharacterized protein LOC128203416 n=1 Tax=Mya arenaria TaxID=6604 RepID=UPI0022E40946|nr:uncharacterized protein LOC128203416 [Mya arenaria]
MCLMPPQWLSVTTGLSIVPVLSIYEIYNYLIRFYDHASLRAYHQFEGYEMFQDGYTRDIETVLYPNTVYFAVKVKVKPRTNDKDPITKRDLYKCWIVTKNVEEGSIKYAYCICKGGTQTAMPLYSPLSEEFPTPDPNIFLQRVNDLQPTACALRAV